MDTVMIVAAILAFTPTLILMYVVLRKYTYPAVEQPFFSDPAFFGLFAVGLVAGTILSAVMFVSQSMFNFLYPVLFAAIQCLAMVVVLNLKRFHGKSDTVFYGYGIGIGIGCTMAFGTVFFMSSMVNLFEKDSIDVLGYLWLVLIAVSQILMASSIGTIIGEGIARLKPMEFALQAMFVNVVYNLIIFAAYSNEEPLWLYVLLLLAFAVAAIHFYYVMYVKLSGVVKDVLRMEGKTRNDVPK